jgi:hypothetical protein
LRIVTIATPSAAIAAMNSQPGNCAVVAVWSTDIQPKVPAPTRIASRIIVRAMVPSIVITPVDASARPRPPTAVRPGPVGGAGGAAPGAAAPPGAA